MSAVFTVATDTVAAARYEPFRAFDEVVSGDPAAEVAWLRTESAGEGMLYTGMFRVRPSVFRYTFAGDESFHVLAGAVEIAVDGGECTALGSGGIASFPKGARSTWTVHEPLTKFFVISG
jgi:uncharacterized cupin superfamily protein